MPETESLHYDSLLHNLYAAADHQHPSCQVNLISEAVEKNNVKQFLLNHNKTQLQTHTTFEN